MKKFVSIGMLAVLVLSLCACGGGETAQLPEKSMLDLTRMSSTVMFAELYNMTMDPENYVGRPIKMQGQFTAFANPVTGDEEYALMTVDAAACCVQGLDLSLAEGSPAPAVDSQVTVTGVYQKYTEGGMTRYHIADAVWE